MSKIVQIKEKEGLVLREISKPVSKDEFGTNELNDILEKMKESLSKESDGVALAAPQIAISKRIFIISPLAYKNEKHNGKKHFIFINPVIEKISKDRKLMDEGCLSVRPLYGRVRRASKATIQAQDENGKKFEMSASGLIAQIFQHETDHLDGILFIDKAKNVFEINNETINENE
jgi:peptide deformylase